MSPADPFESDVYLCQRIQRVGCPRGIISSQWNVSLLIGRPEPEALFVVLRLTAVAPFTGRCTVVLVIVIDRDSLRRSRFYLLRSLQSKIPSSRRLLLGNA